MKSIVVVLFSSFLASCAFGDKEEERRTVIHEPNLLYFITDILQVSSDHHTLVFYGESDHWQMAYVLNPEKNDELAYEVLRYKKSDAASLIFDEGDETDEPPVAHEISFPDGQSSGQSYLNRDYTIHGFGPREDLDSEDMLSAVVEWEGEREEITLSK